MTEQQRAVKQEHIASTSGDVSERQVANVISRVRKKLRLGTQPRLRHTESPGDLFRY